MFKKRDKIDNLFKEHFKSKQSLPASLAITACSDQDQLPLLGQYIDGSLDKATRLATKKHILGCKKCQEIVSDITSALEKFHKNLLPEAPNFFTSEELFRISKPRPSKKSS